MHAVSKYLEDYAEPEIRLAATVDGGYERVLVVPLHREDPSFLDGFGAAAETSMGRTLCIAVVNASDAHPESAHAENARLVNGMFSRWERTLMADESAGAWLGSSIGGRLDVLVVDRASAGRRLPAKHGVGLARKIGTDVALALYVSGKVRSSFAFGTDADAVLPNGYFDWAGSNERTDVAAVVFPFWHDGAPDAEVARATALYELSLRYYVAGLAWAGSPYAFHTLGSATAVSLPSYAAVRGYPKREAAEDFYLLNKIAKVGAIFRRPGPPVRIRSRISDRTPFGTGRYVADAMASGDRAFYAPDVFLELRTLIRALTAFAERGGVERVYEGIAALSEGPRAAILRSFDEFDARAALEAANRESKTAVARFRRVHSWFDAFRTLKCVHALRDRCFPSLPWREALVRAPFYGRETGASHDVVEERRAFSLVERSLPLYVGPTVVTTPSGPKGT